MRLSAVVSRGVVAFLLAGASLGSQGTPLHDWENPQLVGINKQEPHATLVPFPDRLTALARDRLVTLALKGQRTLIAFPDGRVWINPTGTPAMAKGGSGDILTGLIAGLLAQFPSAPEPAIAAAVWLHGRAGELGAAEWGEKALVATDLLGFLPEAMDELSALPDSL